MPQKQSSFKSIIWKRHRSQKRRLELFQEQGRGYNQQLIPQLHLECTLQGTKTALWQILYIDTFLSLSLNSFITFFNYLYRQHAIGVSNPVVDAAPLNMAQSNRNMTDVEDSPETLQNIMRVTRDQESVFKVVWICMKLSLQI